MISAVIITHNEERNIGRCLASLEGIADEVLVLDGHSTDRTVEICKEYGARVVDQDWLGYAATKNLGNDLAQYSYILSIDADEAISPILRVSLLSIKGELTGAYSFNRLGILLRQADPPWRLVSRCQGAAVSQGPSQMGRQIRARGIAARRAAGTSPPTRGFVASHLLHGRRASHARQALRKACRRQTEQEGETRLVVQCADESDLAVPANVCFSHGLSGRMARMVHCGDHLQGSLAEILVGGKQEN
jgi:hypothetical protein